MPRQELKDEWLVLYARPGDHCWSEILHSYEDARGIFVINDDAVMIVKVLERKTNFIKDFVQYVSDKEAKDICKKLEEKKKLRDREAVILSAP